MSICSTAVLGGSHATDARPDAVKSMTWPQVDVAGRSIALNPPGRLQTKKRRAVVPIYRGLPEIDYPMHDRDVLVTACGRICMHKKKINISTVKAGQRLGLKEVDDGIWVVTFMAYDLGYIDLEQKTLQPIDNPFGTRVSPMS